MHLLESSILKDKSKHFIFEKQILHMNIPIMKDRTEVYFKGPASWIWGSAHIILCVTFHVWVYPLLNWSLNEILHSPVLYMCT